MKDSINCIIVDDEAIAREILENHLSRISQVKIIASCKNALEAFQLINTQSVDLIFLDINMPEISGLSFAKALTRDIKIIFTTAYREYAVDGFDLQAVDYLLKPISFDRLLQAIHKYMSEGIQLKAPVSEVKIEEASSDSFFVRSDRKMTRIRFTDVIFIESLGDYVKIHMANKRVTTRETLSAIEEKLPNQEFLKVHRSFIVAVKHIDSFTNEYIEVGERQIPISRGCKDDVLKTLEEN